MKDKDKTKYLHFKFIDVFLNCGIKGFLWKRHTDYELLAIKTSGQPIKAFLESYNSEELQEIPDPRVTGKLPG